MRRHYARSVEAKIGRLTREIAKIDQFFYGTEEASERHLYAGMLERKRDDMVGSIVLQLHTATEDVLNSWITCRILGVRPEDRKVRMRTKSARALGALLFGARSIGFDAKLNLAVALRLMTSATRRKLAELNGLRNKCSHNWLLKVPMRRGRRPAEKKPPLLLWRDRDLHSAAALKEFTREFGVLYATLFAKYVDEQERL